MKYSPIRLGGFRSYRELEMASLLELCNSKYHYEQDTYKLPNGKYYLPDFKLRSCFVEVKSRKPNHQEKEKARQLSLIVNKPVGIVDGLWKSSRSYLVFRNGQPDQEYFTGKRFVKKEPSNIRDLNQKSLLLAEVMENNQKADYDLIEQIIGNERTIPFFVKKAVNHNRKHGWRDYVDGSKAPKYKQARQTKKDKIKRVSKKPPKGGW